MELRYTKEQEAMKRAVQQFAESIIAPLVPEMERTDAFPFELISKMASNGLMGIPISKKWGGAGSDFISYIAAIHEISKVSATAGVILSVHTSVGTLPIVQYGTEEQKKKYVSKLASGQWLGAFALTETQAGSDAASIRTSAIRSGDHYVLNGAKLFITNAGAADAYLTFAVTAVDKGARGITAFLIEKNSPGLRVGRKEKKMGLHGSNTCELIYEDMQVPISQRLGEEGQGFTIAKGSLDGGRIGIAAQALGIAEATLEAAFRHLLPRPDLSGTPANSRTAVHSLHDSAPHVRLAELAAQTEAARLLVYRAAYMRQEGIACTKEASTAKMFASDTAVAVTSEVIRLLGPEGYSKEYPFERLFRDAKVTQIYEGTNEIHRIVIGNQLLKL